MIGWTGRVAHTGQKTNPKEMGRLEDTAVDWKDNIKIDVQIDVVAGTEFRWGYGFLWAQLGPRNMREVSF